MIDIKDEIKEEYEENTKYKFSWGGYYAKVIEHSIHPEYSINAVTMEIRFPRIILAELNTHSIFSKNTASSRAIPTPKLISDIKKNMFCPVHYGKNIKGMQSNEELTGWRLFAAKFLWRLTGDVACDLALLGHKLGMHKQTVNRLIEPFSWVTVCVTSTDFHNFLALRNHEDAQPEIKVLAQLIERALSKSKGKRLQFDEWHLPYINKDERNTHSFDELIKISIARCASTSYKTVDKKPITTDKAIDLFEKLMGAEPIHASPAEHQLTPDAMKILTLKNGKMYQIWNNRHFHGNMHGFIQYRKTIKGEHKMKIDSKSIEGFING